MWKWCHFAWVISQWLACDSWVCWLILLKVVPLFLSNMITWSSSCGTTFPCLVELVPTLWGLNKRVTVWISRGLSGPKPVGKPKGCVLRLFPLWQGGFVLVRCGPIPWFVTLSVTNWPPFFFYFTFLFLSHHVIIMWLLCDLLFLWCLLFCNVYYSVTYCPGWLHCPCDVYCSCDSIVLIYYKY